MRLGKRSKHQYIALFPDVIERMGVVDSSLFGEVLSVVVVSLIENNGYMLRYSTQELISLARIEQCTRWIVGIGKEHDARLVVNCSADGIKVESIFAHGYLNQFSARSFGRDRIDDERALTTDCVQSRPEQDAADDAK